MRRRLGARRLERFRAKPTERYLEILGESASASRPDPPLDPRRVELRLVAKDGGEFMARCSLDSLEELVKYATDLAQRHGGGRLTVTADDPTLLPKWAREG